MSHILRVHSESLQHRRTLKSIKGLGTVSRNISSVVARFKPKILLLIERNPQITDRVGR